MGASEPSSVSIGTVLGTLPDRPISSSRDLGWSGVTLDVHRHMDSYSVRTPARDHHLICYCPSGGARLVQGRDGRVYENMIYAGMSLMMPAGQDSTWGGDAAAFARLRVLPSLVFSAAEQIGVRNAGTHELRNVFEMHDAVIERIARILMEEIDRPEHPAQTLLVESLSCALAAHLLRSYNGFDIPPEAQIAPLKPVEIQRQRAFIEDNLDRSIGLADMASVARISRFHFARLFKKSTGVTATHYLETCRIGRAKTLIADTDLPLAQIALTVGFGDQSHFTSASGGTSDARLRHSLETWASTANAKLTNRSGDGAGASPVRWKGCTIGLRPTDTTDCDPGLDLLPYTIGRPPPLRATQSPNRVLPQDGSYSIYEIKRAIMCPRSARRSNTG